MNPTEFVQETILDQKFLGDTVYEWLVFGLIWVTGAVLIIGIHRLVSWRIGILSQRTTNAFDDYFSDLMKRTRVYFLVAAALLIATSASTLLPKTTNWLENVSFVVIMIQILIWSNGIIEQWITRYKEQRIETDAAAVTTVQAVGFLLRIVLYSIVFLVTLDYFGVDITALVAGLGVGGIAVALAVQNILGDLFASLSIVLDKPFVVGDALAIDTFSGTVEHVGLKTTRLRSVSGEQIIISNGDLLKSRIRNYKRMFERRVVFSIGISYLTPHEKVKTIAEILREIVSSQDQVRFDRAHFMKFGDYALQYEVVYFVLSPDYNLHMDIQQNIFIEIHKRFRDEQIDFAYPTQSLFVESLPKELVTRVNDGNSKN